MPEMMFPWKSPTMMMLLLLLLSFLTVGDASWMLRRR
jgi:hypothetical protein